MKLSRKMLLNCVTSSLRIRGAAKTGTNGGLFHGRVPMNFNAEELKYLRHVLDRATNYTIAQGRESVAPSIRHDKLIDKIKMYEDRLRYG